MSWNSSFSNTTAPSVVATLRPTSKTLSSVCETWPLLHVAQQLLHAGGQALALGVERQLQRLGVERQEVARR